MDIKNFLILGDNLDVLKDWHSNGRQEFIDLVYNDLPFKSNRDYNILFNPDTDTTEEAFKDTWSSIKYIDLIEDFKENDIKFYEFLKRFELLLPNNSLKAYITIMGITYWYIHKMLKPTGSLYHHCDPTTNSYIKIILDRIFDITNFRNEIIWPRTSNSGSWKTFANHFSKDHDVILFYSKTSSYKFKHTIIEYNLKEIQTLFSKNDNDGKGPYRINTLIHIQNYEDLKSKNEAGWNSGSKYPWYKEYFERGNQGRILSTIWSDVKPLGPRHSERLGYPTQKPEKLLERIISTSSEEGDLVSDFFIGGGTTLVVANKLNRYFLGVDINHRAIQITNDRLRSLKLTPKHQYVILGIPRSAKELRELVEKNILGKAKNSRFEFEELIIKYYLDGVQGNVKKVGDHSIDGVFFFTFQEKNMKGIVQVTTRANIGHLKASCSEIGKGNADMCVYISFEDTITRGMKEEVKSYGRIGDVDRVQILPVEDLIDNGKQFEVPSDTLKFN